MNVKQLIEELSKFDPEMVVLGEYDMDGDEFMVKIELNKVYMGNGVGDDWDGEGDEDEKQYCVIQLKY